MDNIESLTDAPLVYRNDATLQEIVHLACGMETLLDALTVVCIWESERAIKQALKWKETGKSTAASGGGWDTCFRVCLKTVMLNWSKGQRTMETLNDITGNLIDENLTEAKKILEKKGKSLNDVQRIKVDESLCMELIGEDFVLQLVPYNKSRVTYGRTYCLRSELDWEYKKKEQKASVEKCECGGRLVADDMSAVDSRFTTEGDIVTDVSTGMEWRVGPDRNTTWDEAQKFAKGFQSGEWRLPTIKELRGLYEKGKGTRNIDPVFSHTGWWVWSGELYEYDSSSAWYFDFSYGYEYWGFRDLAGDYYRVFAVRSGRCG